MEGWQQISADSFAAQFPIPYTVFHTERFNTLNQDKADNLIFLMNKQAFGTYGVIFGMREGVCFSPFSAPFGGITYNDRYDLQEVDQVCRSLVSYFRKRGERMRITLPPEHYNTAFICCMAEAFLAAGAHLEYTDSNYHLPIETGRKLQDLLARNARKNLNKALGFEHQFIEATCAEAQKQAYDVIQQNRTERGFPLRMRYEDLQATARIIRIRYFMIKHGGEASAAAVIFHVSDTVAMVVYWGHLEAFSELRPVNLLSAHLYTLFQTEGISTLDIGPSSENGVLNEGLARFKVSIGCVTSNKKTLLFTP